MPFIVSKAFDRHHQITFEEVFFNESKNINYKNDPTNTITRFSNTIPDGYSVEYLINILEKFVERNKHLYEVDRHTLYRKYRIPKKKGGWRKICAPTPQLSTALIDLKRILESSCGLLYHTNAYAYIKGRSCKMCAKKHNDNKSRHCAMFDFQDFFGSTTKEFVLRMFSMVYPLCLLFETERGKKAISDAIDIAFIDGGLPQGSESSPTITNIMMIPFDYALAKEIRKLDKSNFVISRYADDIHISSKYHFDYKKSKE